MSISDTIRRRGRGNGGAEEAPPPKLSSLPNLDEGLRDIIQNAREFAPPGHPDRVRQTAHTTCLAIMDICEGTGREVMKRVEEVEERLASIRSEAEAFYQAIQVVGRNLSDKIAEVLDEAHDIAEKIAASPLPRMAEQASEPPTKALPRSLPSGDEPAHGE